MENAELRPSVPCPAPLTDSGEVMSSVKNIPMQECTGAPNQADTVDGPKKRGRKRLPRLPQAFPALEKPSPEVLESFSLSDWLDQNHLSKYQEAFAENSITTPGELASLPPSSYSKVLGIRSHKDKKQLGGAIQMLHEAITEHIQKDTECHTQPLSTQQRITSRIVSSQSVRIPLETSASERPPLFGASQSIAFSSTQQTTQRRKNKAKRVRDFYFTLTRLFDYPPRALLGPDMSDAVSAQPFWASIHPPSSLNATEGMRHPETAEWWFSSCSKYQDLRPPLWDLSTLLADSVELPDALIDKPRSSVRTEVVDAVQNLHKTTNELIQNEAQRMCAAVQEVIMSFEYEKQKIVTAHIAARSNLQKDNRLRLTQTETEAIFPDIAWPKSCDVSIKIVSQRGGSAGKSHDTQTISRDRIDCVSMCNELLNLIDVHPENITSDHNEQENKKVVELTSGVENSTPSGVCFGSHQDFCFVDEEEQSILLVHSPERFPPSYDSHTEKDTSNELFDGAQINHKSAGKIVFVDREEPAIFSEKEESVIFSEREEPAILLEREEPIIDTEIQWNGSFDASGVIETHEGVTSPMPHHFDTPACENDGEGEDTCPPGSGEFNLEDFAGTGLLDGLRASQNTNEVVCGSQYTRNLAESNFPEESATFTNAMGTPEEQITGTHSLEFRPQEPFEKEVNRNDTTTFRLMESHGKPFSEAFDTHRLSETPIAGVFHGGCSDDTPLCHVGGSITPNLHESPRTATPIDASHPLSPFNSWGRAALKCECRKNGLKIGNPHEMRTRLNLLWKKSAAHAFTVSLDSLGKPSQDERLPISQHASEWLSQNASQASQKTARDKGNASNSVKVSAEQLMRAATFLLRTASSSCASSLSVMERLLLLEAVTLVEVQIAVRRLAEQESVKASADRLASIATSHSADFLLIYRSCLKKLRHCTVSFVKNWLRFSGITVKTPLA